MHVPIGQLNAVALNHRAPELELLVDWIRQKPNHSAAQYTIQRLRYSLALDANSTRNAS